MPTTILPIGGGFYKSSSLPISAQECVNFYPHVPEAAALNTPTMLGAPGIYQVDTAGTTSTYVCRGAHAMNGVPYFVLGDTLYSLGFDETLTSIGTIPGTGRVSIADNGLQMMIVVPGGAGYTYTEATATLAEIADADLYANGNPQAVVFLDGYFVCTTDDKKFILSELNDGTSWNPLQFGVAESSPDGVVVPIVYKNQLFVGGERTIEAFNNIGGVDFPFQRTGLFLDKGVLAPFSVISAYDTFMFVGAGENEGPAVYQLSGNTTERVSTHAIDILLADLSTADLSRVFAWSYAQSGHYFVGFTLPETSVVYDVSTGVWHERNSRVEIQTGVYDQRRYRVNAVVGAMGKLYVGDADDGRVGVLDLDTYTEYGNAIVRRFSTQPFQANMKPLFIPKLELTVESGVGDDTTTDPVISMDISRDGGKTYLDPKTRPIGKKGEYDRRVIWRRNGRTGRFDIYRFTLSDPVKPVIIQLTAEMLGGSGATA